MHLQPTPTSSASCFSTFFSDDPNDLGADAVINHMRAPLNLMQQSHQAGALILQRRDRRRPAPSSGGLKVASEQPQALNASSLELGTPKASFFANVSAEWRDPPTLIVSPRQQLLERSVELFASARASWPPSQDGLVQGSEFTLGLAVNDDCLQERPPGGMVMRAAP
jgi:hypothetical protein